MGGYGDFLEPHLTPRFDSSYYFVNLGEGGGGRVSRPRTIQTILPWPLTAQRRHGGHMVSARDSESSDPGLNPGTFSLTLPLSTQVRRWVLGNAMLGVTLQWTTIPSRRSPSCFKLQEQG